VGPQLAEVLGLPQVTLVEEIRIHGNRVTAKSNFDGVIRVIEMNMPALMTVSRQINRPRFKTMNAVLRAFRDKEVITWTGKELKLNPMRIGINGSPTWVRKTFAPSHSRAGIVVEKQSTETAQDILDYLLEKSLLQF
jgi:electron transfer flavoprotein beta subunit